MVQGKAGGYSSAKFVAPILSLLGIWPLGFSHECMANSGWWCPCAWVGAYVSAACCLACLLVWLCSFALGILAVLLGLCVVPSCHSACFSMLSSFTCVAELWGLYTVTLHSALMQLLLTMTLYSSFRVPLPRCLHCLSVLFSMYHCQDAFIMRYSSTF